MIIYLNIGMVEKEVRFIDFFNIFIEIRFCWVYVRLEDMMVNTIVWFLIRWILYINGIYEVN